MRINDFIVVGQTRRTTEPLGCTDGSILRADSIVTVTGREQRGWTVEAADGRVAEWVAGAQLAPIVNEED